MVVDPVEGSKQVTANKQVGGHPKTMWTVFFVIFGPLPLFTVLQDGQCLALQEREYYWKF